MNLDFDLLAKTRRGRKRAAAQAALEFALWSRQYLGDSPLESGAWSHSPVARLGLRAYW